MAEPTEDSLENYRLTVAYDGRGFLGWQRHGDKPTVQFVIERAVTQAFGIREPVRGSGRTDRGAHATGQVASVRLPPDLDPLVAVEVLNEALPAEVRIREISRVEDAFHACDSAIAKRYRYVIWNQAKLPPEQEGRVWHVPGRLDAGAMIDVCPIFVGELDFASFAKRPNFKQQSTRRTVTRATLRQEAPRLIFEMCADGFLYKMVRNIVRAIVKVGEGRHSAEDLRRILASCDRKAAPGTAPASGLYLDRVYYPGDDLGDDRGDNRGDNRRDN